MYLLYLDDSGSVKNQDDTHVVLAGLAVFERQPYWLSKKLDELAERIWPDSPSSIEFRGADIRSGKRQWRGMNRDKRADIYRAALSIIAESPAKNVRLFGVAVDKIYASPQDAMEIAFEHACNRFDRFLHRLHNNNDTHRGLIILDESAYETSLQALATSFRSVGHRWGRLHNLCDVPLFVNSKATRLIQYADLVAYAMRQFYEKDDESLFSIVKNKFDAEGGV